MIIRGNSVGHPLPDPKLGLNMQAGINMNGNKLNGIAKPVDDDDAVNWGSVKDIGKVERVEVTLSTAKWTADETAGFIQSVTVEGLTDEKKCKVYPAIPVTMAGRTAIVDEIPKIKAASRTGSTVTFEAWEEKPEADIVVIVEVIT